jgi:hypothetical protein
VTTELPELPVPDLPVARHVTLALHDFVRAAGTRRALPTVLHLGHPRAEEVVLAEQGWYDAGARADLVTRALEGLADPAPLAWLTRRGELDPTDADLAWCAAARTGFGRHGLVLDGFYVVTRTGWVDLTSDTRQEWVRVRPNRRVAGG